MHIFSQPHTETRLPPKLDKPYRGTEGSLVLSLVLNSCPELFQSDMAEFLHDPLACSNRVDLFLKHDASPNIQQKNKKETPFLIQAIQRNHPRAFKLLMKFRTLKLDQPDPFGLTPLSHAVFKNRPFAIKALLTRGADPTIPDEIGRTPLDWAALFGKKTLLKEMLTRGWSNGLSQAETDRLHQLAASQTLEASKLRPLSLPDKKQALMDNAVKENNLEQLTASLSAGASVNEACADGCSALIHASGRNHKVIAHALLASGANPNFHSRNDETALIRAIAQDHFDLAATLLKAGADPNQTVQDGYTPLAVAIFKQNKALCEQLLGAGADINANYPDGMTNLKLAIEYGTTSILQTLLEAGADVKTQGLEAVEFAQTLQKKKMSNMIKAHPDYPKPGSKPCKLLPHLTYASM